MLSKVFFSKEKLWTSFTVFIMQVQRGNVDPALLHPFHEQDGQRWKRHGRCWQRCAVKHRPWSPKRFSCAAESFEPTICRDCDWRDWYYPYSGTKWVVIWKGYIVNRREEIRLVGGLMEKFVMYVLSFLCWFFLFLFPVMEKRLPLFFLWQLKRIHVALERWY